MYTISAAVLTSEASMFKLATGVCLDPIGPRVSRNTKGLVILLIFRIL